MCSPIASEENQSLINVDDLMNSKKRRHENDFLNESGDNDQIELHNSDFIGESTGDVSTLLNSSSFTTTDAFDEDLEFILSSEDYYVFTHPDSDLPLREWNESRPLKTKRPRKEKQKHAKIYKSVFLPEEEQKIAKAGRHSKLNNVMAERILAIVHECYGTQELSDRFEREYGERIHPSTLWRYCSELKIEIPKKCAKKYLKEA